MKKLFAMFAIILSSQTAQADLSREVVETYAKNVEARYSAALEGGYQILNAVNTFIANPTAENMEAAKLIWTEARKAYSLTEVYRFYSGPIDDKDGPEGLLNAWPMDEAYVDYVLGNEDAGIVQNPAAYPVIDRELLISLNELNGEKNIATGYHAIEFLLWGQDLDPNGPGARPYTDYVVGQNAFAERRAQYLKVAAELLVYHLESLVVDWNPKDPSSYASQFLAPSETKASLEKIFSGATFLASEELSQERMFVALDTGFQEDEHSCFSDTTHNDVLYNFLGIKDVFVTTQGPGLLDLIRTKDSVLADKISVKLIEIENQFAAIPAPFDQAIIEDVTRAQLLETITALEDLGTLGKEGAQLLSLTLIE